MAPVPIRLALPFTRSIPIYVLLVPLVPIHVVRPVLIVVPVVIVFVTLVVKMVAVVAIAMVVSISIVILRAETNRSK